MTSSENSKWRKIGLYSKHVPMIFFRPFNEPKQLPKSKCACIEDHARMFPTPGVKVDIDIEKSAQISFVVQKL